MRSSELDDGGRVLVADDLESRGVLAAFTERTGGVSPSPYESLNLGLKTGDRREQVVTNRRRVVDGLRIPTWAMGTQVHGAKLLRVGASRAGSGFEDPDATLGPADALAVTRPRLPVAVVTADCVPLVLASPKEERVVLVHAGWRGIAAGILDHALGPFERPGGIWAAIGPSIRACHYEVGEDVALAVAAGSVGGAVTERRHGRLFLDPAATVAKALRSAGVRNVEDSGLCTACHPSRFFSHRRDGSTGRQAAIAMRL